MIRTKSNFSSAISFLVILWLVWYSYDSQRPEVDDDLGGDQIEFVLDNAKAHVQSISQRPHYSGSEYQKEVRDYLISELKKIGLDPQMQTGYSVDENGNVAQPVNIMARMEGASDGDKALLLMTHYDSDPHSSYGASDAASGVATILEGMRSYRAAIENGTVRAPANDIIILFTDAEELGLNGAQLFVDEHPWAADVGVALNFESRGSGGPSYMLLETNGGNRRLMKMFDGADVDFPVTNSLAYSIYKKLPNDTDLTVLREDADINGLNFAFIDDHYDYHTSRDTYDRLDDRSLAHQASYLMPLLTTLADINIQTGLSAPQGADDVYFNFPWLGVLRFPFSWLPWLIALGAISLILLPFAGQSKYRMQLLDIFKSLGLFVLAMAVSYAVVQLGYNFVAGGSAYYEEQINGFPYNGHWWIATASMFAIAICFCLYRKIYDPRKVAAHAYGPLLLLWVICLLTAFSLDGTAESALVPAIYLPGAGYFIIPMLFGALMVWLNIRQRRPSYWFLVLFALPAIFIFSPFVKAFPVALCTQILLSNVTHLVRFTYP